MSVRKRTDPAQPAVCSALYSPHYFVRRSICTATTVNHIQQLSTTTTDPQTKEDNFNLDEFPISGPGMAGECKTLLSNRGQPGKSKKPVRAY